MAEPLDPRRSLRELVLGIDALLPFARASTAPAADITPALASSVAAVNACRRLDALPWSPFLDASLQHLTPSEVEALSAGAAPDPFLLSMANDHAWLLYCPDPMFATRAALGPGLAALFALAQKHGFRYVRIDEDAPPIPGLLIHAVTPPPAADAAPTDTLATESIRHE